MIKLVVLIMGVGLVLFQVIPVSCTRSDNSMINEKVSSQLLNQVTLRKAQIADPASDRLTMMKGLGMNVDNLGIQRIFIHLNQALNPAQINELEAMGITLYLNSWIPPVGSHPTGFIVADMPIDKLAKLTRMDYVVKLETAEQLLEPQNQAQPQ